MTHKVDTTRLQRTGDGQIDQQFRLGWLNRPIKRRKLARGPVGDSDYLTVPVGDDSQAGFNEPALFPLSVLFPSQTTTMMFIMVQWWWFGAWIAVFASYYTYYNASEQSAQNAPREC